MKFSIFFVRVLALLAKSIEFVQFFLSVSLYECVEALPSSSDTKHELTGSNSGEDTTGTEQVPAFSKSHEWHLLVEVSMDIVGDHLINLITSNSSVSILLGVNMDLMAMSLTLGISLFLEPLDGVGVLVHLKLLLVDLILTELIEVLKLGNLFSELVVGDLKSQDIFVEMLDRVVHFSKLSVEMVKLGELFLALKFELS